MKGEGAGEGEGESQGESQGEAGPRPDSAAADEAAVHKRAPSGPAALSSSTSTTASSTHTLHSHNAREEEREGAEAETGRGSDRCVCCCQPALMPAASPAAAAIRALIHPGLQRGFVQRGQGSVGRARVRGSKGWSAAGNCAAATAPRPHPTCCRHGAGSGCARAAGDGSRCTGSTRWTVTQSPLRHSRSRDRFCFALPVILAPGRHAFFFRLRRAGAVSTTASVERGAGERGCPALAGKLAEKFEQARQGVLACWVRAASRKRPPAVSCTRVPALHHPVYMRCSQHGCSYACTATVFTLADAAYSNAFPP